MIHKITSVEFAIRTIAPKWSRRRHLSGCMGLGVAIALLVSMTPGSAQTVVQSPVQPTMQRLAQLFDSPVDRLPAADRVLLRSGKPLVTGEKGSFTGKILLTTTPELAWAVLTDYANFAKFLPNVVSSKVLETNGNRKVIEQEDVRQVFILRVRSRVRSAITETTNQRIEFRRIAGDVPKLEGYWLLEPVAPFKGAKANQVLVTQVVSVQPGSGVPAGTFYNIFKNALNDNLAAIAQEVQRRSAK